MVGRSGRMWAACMICDITMGTRGIDTVKVKLYVFILSSVERAPARVHEQLGIAFTKRRGALSFCVTQRLSPHSYSFSDL
jgi:hypothetical protein